MICTRSQTASTSGRMCVERITLCAPPSSRISARISRIWFGSRPTVGSSRMTTSGPCSDRLRDADPLLVALRQRADQLAPDIGQAAAALRVVDGSAAACPRHAMQLRCERRGIRRRSARDRAADARAGSRCGLWRRAARAKRSMPQMLIAPSVGARLPVSICMVVVLPAPLGPRKPRTSPRFKLQR